MINRLIYSYKALSGHPWPHTRKEVVESLERLPAAIRPKIIAAGSRSNEKKTAPGLVLFPRRNGKIRPSPPLTCWINIRVI